MEPDGQLPRCWIVGLPDFTPDASSAVSNVNSRVPRFLGALLIFAAATYAWLWLVGGIGIWWITRHPEAVPAGTDTYFITSSGIFRFAAFVPVIVFAAWYWHRFVTRAA